MALTGGTLYVCIQTHTVTFSGTTYTNQQGDLRLGAAEETASNQFWVAAGSSEAQIRTARVSAGLPPLGG
jgi:hypothetical protein